MVASFFSDILYTTGIQDTDIIIRGCRDKDGGTEWINKMK